jgi:tyrosyl-tRNA synthetase
MTIFKDLEQRGLIKDVTHGNELESFLAENKVTLYCGFDPTADSLHVGSLLPLVTLMRFSIFGHTPLALIGGATGLIGDPSGKADERTLNTEDIVNSFKKAISEQINSIISCDTVDNFNWTNSMSIIEFLRDIGKEFTVNSMMAKESVKNRIDREEQGISFTEFSYMLLQSMDFFKLKESHNCSLQIGGSDQWGNITSGIELIRKKCGHKEKAFGLTIPLLTKSDGSKFGKSEKGNIWLDPNKTSPFKFFQFWLGTSDSDIYKFMRFFSLKTVEEIDAIEKLDKESGSKPIAQKLLAEELTELVHGKNSLNSVIRITDSIFSSGFDNLTELDFEQLTLDVLETFELKENSNIVDVLVESNLAKSKRLAREFISNNAISINGDKNISLDFKLIKSDGFFNKFHVIKRGKKNISLIKIV